jgi:hypothetical protein
LPWVFSIDFSAMSSALSLSTGSPVFMCGDPSKGFWSTHGLWWEGD